MNVLVTGASGFVGSRLCARLRARGDTVEEVSRARGATVDWSEASLSAALSRAHAVVNLAGANVFGKRWTEAYKRELVESRVPKTELLSHLAARAGVRTLVSASAVGFYGFGERMGLDESSPRGDDFLAHLCGDWEAATKPAEDGGVRVTRLRIGLVLGPDGGALERMAKIFRLGLGGRLGSGRQWVSWIERDDLCAMIERALDDASERGAWNATAPTPVTNAELTRALANELHRPALFPAPAFAIRLALGAAAYVVLEGQHVVPKKALAAGFTFRCATIEAALAAALRQRDASSA